MTDQPFDVEALRRQLREAGHAEIARRSEHPDAVTDVAGHRVLMQQDLDLIERLRPERQEVRQMTANAILAGAAGELVKAATLVYQGEDRSELVLPMRAVRRAILVAEQLAPPPL